MLSLKRFLNELLRKLRERPRYVPSRRIHYGGMQFARHRRDDAPPGDAAVRQPRSTDPGSRSAAASVSEPDEDSLTAIVASRLFVMALSSNGGGWFDFAEAVASVVILLG